MLSCVDLWIWHGGCEAWDSRLSTFSGGSQGVPPDAIHCVSISPRPCLLAGCSGLTHAPGRQNGMLGAQILQPGGLGQILPCSVYVVCLWATHWACLCLSFFRCKIGTFVLGSLWGLNEWMPREQLEHAIRCVVCGIVYGFANYGSPLGTELWNQCSES